MEYNLFGSIEHSVTSLWVEVVQFMPLLLMAVLVLIIGWIVGILLAGLIQKLFVKFHIDDALDKAGVDDLSKRAGYNFRPGHFAGALVKWFIILAFAVVAFDILGLSEVTIFMREVVLGYLPQVFVAVLILFASVLIASVADKSLTAALRAGGSSRPEFFGKIAYYLVIAFGVMAMLNQLSIADELVETLFTGIIFALSLGFGLAFGLGGKEAAARYINRMTNSHKERE